MSDDINMQQVWDTEQEILDVVHAFCKENHIRYSLFYGTLLGAVRHKGFIPWDDDIDLIMPRSDFNKFVKLWNQNPPTGYLYQDQHTDTDLPNNFAKIRKDHTTFLQFESERTSKYHKGIFIDIFPMDKVARGKFARKIQLLAAMISMLYTRGYKSGRGGLFGIGETLLLALPRKIQIHIRDKAEKITLKWNKDKNASYACFSTMDASRVYYQADMFSKLEYIEFAGKKYYTIANPEKFLTLRYGNYMELPPENQRKWFHHPIIIDFENNYEDL